MRLGRPRPSTSSTSAASDTVEACEHFQSNGWSFFLTEWDDEISTEAINEVDAAWNEAATLCTSSTPEDLMQTALPMVSEAAQTSHFHEVQIPEETTRRNRSQNATSRIKFTDKFLKRDPLGRPVVNRCTYDYQEGVTKILNRTERAHLWAITSYVMNFNLLAAEEAHKNKRQETSGGHSPRS